MILHVVIHVLNAQQALTQSLLAIDAGAGRVFLISHLGHDEILPEIAREVKKLRPYAKVGLNCLSSSISKSFILAEKAYADALWFDHVGFHSEHPDARQKSTFIVELLKHQRSGRSMDIFVGVGFKYQRHDPNPGKTALEVSALGCIATTSGAGTGIAASETYIADIRSNLSQEHRLALASGVSLENISLWEHSVTDIFVASSISHDEFTIIPEKVSSLAAACSVLK